MTITGTGTWSYSFDAANRLTSTTNPASETTSFTLDNAGRCTRQDNGNTTYALNSYDTANRITEIQTKNSSGTVLSDIQYSYDGVNVTSPTYSDGTVASFGDAASVSLAERTGDRSDIAAINARRRNAANPRRRKTTVLDCIHCDDIDWMHFSNFSKSCEVR
jgi:YD repeat-containing protein